MSLPENKQRERVSMHVVGRGRAPGKVILLGEHAVVYGYPAIALAIDRYVDVHLLAENGHVDPSMPAIEGSQSLAAKEAGPTLASVLAVAAWHLGLEIDGLHVHVRSQVPAGVGLGSSAALSVATVRALAAFAHRPLSDGAICRAAYEIERLFHGQPSGIDNTAATYGGVLRFRRGEAPVQLNPGGEVPLVVVVGRTARETRSLVLQLRERCRKERTFVERRFAAIGEFVQAAEVALLARDWPSLGALFLRNHATLAELGVSTPELDELVSLALHRGAYGAKLTGAGGGGAVVCLTPEPRSEFVEWFHERGWQAFPVNCVFPEMR